MGVSSKHTTVSILMSFFIPFLFGSCIGTSSNQSKQMYDSHNISMRTGLQIAFGPNQGTSHTDPLGQKHFYLHSTATITNDTTIPIELHLALSNEYAVPDFCGDTNDYKAFILPKELTSDTATIYNSIVNGQHEFLNDPLSRSGTRTESIDPGGFCVVTIGILTLIPTNCASVPRGFFSHDSIGLYTCCDRLNNPTNDTDSYYELGVKLEYYKNRKFLPPDDGCVVIPFGQFSYSEN